MRGLGIFKRVFLLISCFSTIDVKVFSNFQLNAYCSYA